VVGAGTAGSACAIEGARRGLSVALFDPVLEPADKPCGEGIMPGGAEALRRLGLGQVVGGGRPFPGIRFLVDGTGPLEVALDRPGVAIPRPALAAAFAEALDATPGIRRVVQPATTSREDGGFRIDARDDGAFRARTLVVADGVLGRAAAWLRGPHAAGNGASHPNGNGAANGKTRLGVRARCEEKGALDRVEVHMGRGCEVYLTPLPGRLVNVAVLFERTPPDVPVLEDLLGWAVDRHPAAAARLGTTTTPPSARPLAREKPRTVAEGGAFLAGDAGGLVDPIVGCGVAIAVVTGVLAARAAAAIVAGRDPAQVSRSYAAAFRRESAARHALATVLRAGDAHPRLARAVAGLVRRMPRFGRALARVAAGR
jgi:flavin-dependent dehydrogenase